MTYSNPYSIPSTTTNFIPFSGMGMRKNGRAMLLPSNYQGDGSTLSLDFTTMGGVLDPRLTFSRASTATFVNSSGYVEYAGANTAPSSESLIVGSGYNDNAILSRSTTTSPTGNTAVVFYPTLVLDYHRLQFGLSIAMAGSTTISVYVKQIGSDYRAGINAGTYIGASVICSLVGAGSVVGAVGGTAPNRAATITKVTDDGWYRITLTGTYNTISSVYMFMASSTSTDSTGLDFVGVASQGIAIWGLQINPGSTAQTYYPTTTSAYHAPRFDYSPTNIGEPRGLLVEGTAINLCTYSQAIAGAGWNATTGYTVTTNTTDLLSPAGDNTATKLVYTSGYARCIQTVNLAANTTYTMSYWIKSVMPHTFRVYDLTAGADIASSIGSIPVTSSWTRVQKTFTTGASTSSCWFYVAADGGPTAGMTAYVWGAQLEAGSGASSLIPTGASQVTRNADKMSMADISTMQWNQTAGTFSLHMNVSAETNTSSFPTFMGMYTATPVRVVRFRLNNSSGTNPRIGNDIWTSTPSVIVDNQSNTRPAAPTAFKFAVSLSNTGQTMNQIINGGTVVTTSGTGTMETPTKLLWNTDPSAGDTEYFPIHMRSLKYWPTALSNAQLQSITT